MCACRLRLCVRSGLRLRLTHHLSRPPLHHHALPVEDAAGALVISRAGAGCSGERRPTSAVDWRGLALLALLGPDWGGGGPLGLRAQGPVRPGVVGCRWSLRACRHGTLGAPTLWLSEVPPSGSPLPFLGGGRGCPCVVLLGVPCPGGPPDVWGPGPFPCLLHALRDGAVVPHTHY